VKFGLVSALLVLASVSFVLIPWWKLVKAL